MREENELDVGFYNSKIHFGVTNIRQFQELLQKADSLCTELQEVIHRLNRFDIEFEITGDIKHD